MKHWINTDDRYTHLSNVIFISLFGFIIHFSSHNWEFKAELNLGWGGGVGWIINVMLHTILTIKLISTVNWNWFKIWGLNYLLKSEKHYHIHVESRPNTMKSGANLSQLLKGLFFVTCWNWTFSYHSSFQIFSSPLSSLHLLMFPHMAHWLSIIFSIIKDSLRFTREGKKDQHISMEWREHHISIPYVWFENWHPFRRQHFVNQYLAYFLQYIRCGQCLWKYQYRRQSGFIGISSLQ